MRAIAEAHPNIALIKYWGKSDLPGNVPAVPSLSITLSGLVTQTDVELTDGPDEIVVNGEARGDARITGCVDRLRELADYRGGVTVTTTNDFPTAAGLASSASGFAALVGALNAALNLDLSAAQLSVEARRCSASAARSVHGGFVSLTGTDTEPDTWEGRPVASAKDWPLEVVVAICSETPKSVSSSDGMRASAATSPYYERWVATAQADYDAGLEAIGRCDFGALARISESSCLKMHAVMMSTQPALLYWNAATLASLETVRTLQSGGTPVFFTIDAGPQVKAVCLPEAADTVAAALSETDGVEAILRSGIGGPLRITDVADSDVVHTNDRTG